MKNAILTLKQRGASIEVKRSIDTEMTSEVAGTLVHNMRLVRDKAKKYKIDLNGFSFNRKFEIVLTINEESATLNEILGQQSITFSTTLTDKTFENFANMVYDLTEGMLTGANDEITDFLQLFEVSSN
jgi:hypothetical protein